MTLIDQLERTVTTAVLGNDDNVAHTSLLEQFYAILITRLAQPMAYSQLLLILTESAQQSQQLRFFLMASGMMETRWYLI